jgi:hypothetical protein
VDDFRFFISTFGRVSLIQQAIPEKKTFKNLPTRIKGLNQINFGLRPGEVCGISIRDK